MLSEWISWMKKFGSPRPIPSPSYHPGQPHWQRNRWLGWKWVLMTKWRNDEMTFSTSDLGEKSFKEIVYINIYIYIYYFFDPNTRFPKRHFVITSLQVWHHLYKTTIKIVVTYSTHVVYRDKKARISLRASCALSTIVNNLKQNSPSLLTQKKHGKEKRIQKKCVTLWVVDCIDKLKLALRQPFAQQKQLSTPRIQRLGSRAHNKEKEKNEEA